LQTHTLSLSHLLTHSLKNTHTHTTPPPPPTHTHTHTHRHTHPHTHTHTPKHTPKHTHTPTHTHTHRFKHYRNAAGEKNVHKSGHGIETSVKMFGKKRSEARCRG